MKSMFSVSAIVVGLLLAIVVIATPAITIVSINILFGTHIEITFYTWLAMFFLLGTLRWIFQPRSSKS